MAYQQPTTEITLDPTRRYHFVAIGGIGMSAIAQILLARGFKVSGSDIRPSQMLDHLHELGAEINVGHDAELLKKDDVVVLSDAIKPDNPEWARAIEWALPVIKRADLLGCLTNSSRGIAVSGAHGKTTTSGMLALILIEAGMNPTCILGGELAPLGGNARFGGDLMLVEACEAYNSFLNLRPEAAIVTNIEIDHLDFHKTAENLYESFRQFLRQVKKFAVLNGDDSVLRGMISLPLRAVTFGLQETNDYRIEEVMLGAEPSFVLKHGKEDLGVFTLRTPGMHNVFDAAAATALALEFGADLEAVRRGLAGFPGMHRRFERLGNFGDVAVIDDYAHHPTEIRATMKAAKEAFSGRVVALFQPHLFSRTRDFLDEFSQAFLQADVVLIAPIYPAREAPIPGITHHLLAERIAEKVPDKPVICLSSLQEAVIMLSQKSEKIPHLQLEDVILTIGAGDVDCVAHELVKESKWSET